ncbi:hypothetical protein [Thermocrispum agreste]|nr:hypothetical protein [Thermocrispum agreste]
MNRALGEYVITTGDTRCAADVIARGQSVTPRLPPRREYRE